MRARSHFISLRGSVNRQPEFAPCGLIDSVRASLGLTGELALAIVGEWVDPTGLGREMAVSIGEEISGRRPGNMRLVRLRSNP